MPSVSQFMKSMNTECYCSLRSAIDKHIQDVFYKRIQYVCISSPCNPSSSPRVVYVLITHGISSRKKGALVQFSQRWPPILFMLMSLVGPYLEVGKFYSARSQHLVLSVAYACIPCSFHPRSYDSNVLLDIHHFVS